MITHILPKRLQEALRNLDMSKLTEVRLRVGQPTVINYGQPFYLGSQGIVEKAQSAIKITYQELQDLVFIACEYSVYAHNEELKQGFVTLKDGVRVGICGEIVFDNDKIKTIKNFSSVNIRIPHLIKDCSLNILPYLFDEEKVFNTLIISPPGAGKTTYLRDIAYQFSENKVVNNILIIDERNEIASMLNGVNQLDVGMNADIYTNCSKQFGLINGIRTMSPQIIFLDELATQSDIDALDYAIGSGVGIFSTVHSTNIYTLQQKPLFKELLQNNIFERYIVLSTRKGVGTIEGVFDNNYVCLYGGI